MREVERVGVEAVRAVGAQVDEVLADGALEAGRAVGCETHQLVLARVDVEAAEIRERRVEQAE